VLIVNENGKTLADARGEITRAMEYVEHACAGPELMKGSHAEDVGRVSIPCTSGNLLDLLYSSAIQFPCHDALYFVWALPREIQPSLNQAASVR